MLSAKPVSGGEPMSASVNVSSVPSPSMIVRVGAELEVAGKVEICGTEVAGWRCTSCSFGAGTCSDGKGGAYGGVAVKGTAMQSLAAPALM